MTLDEIGSSPDFKKRGLYRDTLALIDAIKKIVEPIQPITGRGVGYKLFVDGKIPSMEKNNMKRVYGALKAAREGDMIPWEWIVDESRALEKTPAWNDPEEYAMTVSTSYRRDFWTQQPQRCEVWSEKGTVRGILAPVLDQYGVGFRVVHGFAGAATVHDIAQGNDDKPFTILYVGDFDPSGMCMSEKDLPARLEKYGGHHINIKRIALTADQLPGLSSFPAEDKKKDTRYKWFVANYGKKCWEIDAFDPTDLRDVVEREIVKLIEPKAWKRCVRINKAEQESLETILQGWKSCRRGAP